MDNIFIRLAIVAITLLVSGSIWLHAVRPMPVAHRFLVNYALLMYSLTYAIGCVILFLFQFDYIFRFYGNSVFFPNATSFGMVLFLGLLPIPLLPLFVGVGTRLVGSLSFRPQREISIGERSFGLLAVLVPSLALVAPIAMQLLSNAVGDLISTSSASSLYAQRALVFDQVSFLQGGVIYSVLPTIAAVILFWPGRSRALSWAAGGMLALFATLLNLGMFQIGPTLSFFLTCGFCYAALRGGRVNPVVAGLAIVAAIVIFTLYAALKQSGNQINQVEVFLMRLPMPLPYLIQFAAEKPATTTQFDSLPYDLGEYMFPEHRAAERFVAMPQPGFVDAWFTYGPVASLLVLVAAAGLIVFLGNRLEASGFGQKTAGPRVVLWAVTAAPALYYFFQVDFFSFLTSAYSVTFVAMPILAIFSIHILTRGMRAPAGASRHFHS